MLSSSFLITLFIILQLTNQIIDSCNHYASCGCSNKSRLYSKIVGGQTARIETWSWVVSVRIQNKFRCAGSIISNLWILTAAHCFLIVNNFGSNVFRIKASDITVHVGSNNQYGKNQLSDVTDIIFHPNFNQLNFNNDIALLKLLLPLYLTDNILAKICLPNISLNEYPPVDSSLVAVGWGRLWENGPESSTLQQVILKAIDYQNATCYPLIYDQLKQFCAGVENSEKDTCQGDSGGPLMMFTSSKQWVIVGITSFGYGCAEPGYSGVYTRITAYLEWINLFINNTNDSIYPYSLISNSPFDDDDIEWQINISCCHSMSIYLFIVILILLYLLTIYSSN
ncbi:unnamed protein product [Rotaria sp. Silwood1]|nr:unnamed protein product [Rotaria sp. Silwood1]CAF3530985.1 unnamed protein product [Rotaria sp. Silwood1]CAF3561729.1 unnamed protein product [Rotaria sp. Silwood1]CAF4679857.1 unnamed protein product [Rotaria sp. Silwood1]CAF4815349.1 unnamed protein product [Rotaria sp. Silwood1]